MQDGSKVSICFHATDETASEKGCCAVEPKGLCSGGLWKVWFKMVGLEVVSRKEDSRTEDRGEHRAYMLEINVALSCTADDV